MTDIVAEVQNAPLINFPPEIIEAIIRRLPKAADIRSLAWTCGAMYDLITNGAIWTDTIYATESVIRSPVGRCFRTCGLRLDKIVDIPQHIRDLLLIVKTPDGYPVLQMPENLVSLTIAYDFQGLGFNKERDIIKFIANPNLRAVSCNASYLTKISFTVDHDYDAIIIQNIKNLIIKPGIKIDYLATVGGNSTSLSDVLANIVVNTLDMAVMGTEKLPPSIDNIVIRGASGNIDLSQVSDKLKLVLENTNPRQLVNNRPIEKLLLSITKGMTTTILPEIEIEPNNPDHRDVMEAYGRHNIDTSGWHHTPSRASVQMVDLSKIMSKEIVIDIRGHSGQFISYGVVWIKMPESIDSVVYIADSGEYSVVPTWSSSRSTLTLDSLHRLWITDADIDKVTVIEAIKMPI